MSLISILKKKIKYSLFTTPSHSQSFYIFPKFKQFYKYDISENDAFCPEVELNNAQKKASSIYKTKSTHFLIGGATSGINASVITTINSGNNDSKKVLIWDSAHRCHKNAVLLAGGEAVFYSVDLDKDWGIYSSINAIEIESALKKEKINAVIVTSPSYEGIVSDIKSISHICKKYGAYLIVDEAHGALYPFSDKLPESAIYQGADFIIQSLHKTAGGLNPTALLHCNLEIDIQAALDLISTTSPSYPLLASIEKNINFLNSSKGCNIISTLINNINKLKANVLTCEFYNKPNFDMTKILVRHNKLSGFELSEFLYSHYIEDEKTNDKSTMLLCGIGTGIDKLKRLEKILKKL